MKHTKKTPFDELLSRYGTLTMEEKRKIVGGDHIDDLFNLIFYTSLFSNSTADQAMLAQLKQDFRDLASTSIGMGVISAIANKVTVTSEKIFFYQDTTLPLNAPMSYNATNNFLNYGSSSAYNNRGYNAFWHELYHAYTDIVLGINNATLQPYFNDVAGEIDANLFLVMAAKQYDKDLLPPLLPKASTVIDDSVTTNPINAYANLMYKTAWDDIVNNGNFTLDNYNALITYFKQGSAYAEAASQSTFGQNYLNGMGQAYQSDLNGYAYQLDDLFLAFYKPIMWPDPGGSGNGYDNGYDLPGSGWGTSGFWDWYNNYGPGSGSYNPYQSSEWEQIQSGATGWTIWINNNTGAISYTNPDPGNSQGGNEDPYNGMSYGEYQSWNNFWGTMFGGNPAYTGGGWGNGFGASS